MRSTALRVRSAVLPFFLAIATCALLATYSLFTTQPKRAPQLLHPSSRHVSCHEISQAQDKCAFAKAHCEDDEAGLLKYLSFYYCAMGDAQPVAFTVLVLWLGLLFTTIGIAASDFFSINLSTIATVLGLSESLAGVTFLAFGNGSPDVFSTFAAMNSNSGSMAVGELLGAAGFITSVVAGSMALVREFEVDKKTFVRDICFFIVAVGFSCIVIADGTIRLWESAVMIGFYVFYVVFVVGWHAYSKRRKRRANVSFAESSRLGERQPLLAISEGLSPTDNALLERGPRIEVNGEDEPENDDDNDDTIDDQDSALQIAVHVSDSMRVSRPRGKRSNTTITPIRPSLIGALELRSMIASMQDSLMPLGRSYSYDRLPRLRAGSLSLPESAASSSRERRNRARSSGAVPCILDADLRRHTSDRNSTSGRASPATSYQIAGRLAPSPGEASSSSRPLQLQIPGPSPHGSQPSSPGSFPFPQYTESPLPIEAGAPEASQFLVSPWSPETGQQLPLSQHCRKWPWPLRLLPSSHVVASTVFPTLQDWRNKTLLDKIVGLISVPSIFVLVVTLPVVETETADDGAENEIAGQPQGGHHVKPVAPTFPEPGGPFAPESEWQHLQQASRANSSGAGHHDQVLGAPETVQLSFAIPDAQYVKPREESDEEQFSEVSRECGWSRWLLCLQLFAGPLFVILIVWANLAEDLAQPREMLLKGTILSSACSLGLIVLVLSTTTETKRPKYHFAFCFLGFIIAITWISTIAGEVVGVLKAFGVILNISEAILGLTIFAIGNSVGDLVADVTVARLGFPVMALSACFGGPMLNILLGIGLGGAYQLLQSPGGSPGWDNYYHLEIGSTLIISAVFLLMTLVALLVAVPLNNWVMSRKLGWGLVALWATGTVVNLVVEVTGVWDDKI